MRPWTDPGDQPKGAGKRHTRRAVTVPADDLFAPVLATPTPVLRGMVRGGDDVTAQRAAVDVIPKRAWIKAAILTAIATEGPKTDGALETRPEFTALGPSTVRKRRSELVAAGRLRAVGVRDKMTLWELTP